MRLFERIAGPGSEAALQAALHAQGFIVCEWVHEALFLGPSEILWFGLLRALRMKPLLLPASGLPGLVLADLRSSLSPGRRLR